MSEEYITIGILRLLELEKAVVEGAGAIGFAAILQGLLPELKGKKVVIPLCGGNIDTTVLGRVLERALVIDGRLVKMVIIFLIIIIIIFYYHYNKFVFIIIKN